MSSLFSWVIPPGWQRCKQASVIAPSPNDGASGDEITTSVLKDRPDTAALPERLLGKAANHTET